MSSLLAVFQIGYLGDSIVSMPALASLRELLPDCSEYILISRIDNKTNVVPSQVFDMKWTAKHQLTYQSFGGALQQTRSIASLIGALRYFRPRYAAYLLPAERSADQVRRDRLFFKLGGVKELVGFRTLAAEELTHGSCPGPTCTEAYLRFARFWNGQSKTKFETYSQTPLLHSSDDAHFRVEKWLRAERRYTDRKLIAVAPFSNYSSRNWSANSIIRLLTRLQNETEAEIVLLGGNKDKDAASAIAAVTGSLNACGAFSIDESAALLQKTQLLIAVESGPMHLGGALGINMLVLFSRITPDLCRWLPLGKGHAVMYREVACAGCRSVVCPVANHPCMADLHPDEVFSIAAKKLEGSVLPTITSNGTRVITF